MFFLGIYCSYTLYTIHTILSKVQAKNMNHWSYVTLRVVLNSTSNVERGKVGISLTFVCNRLLLSIRQSAGQFLSDILSRRSCKRSLLVSRKSSKDVTKFKTIIKNVFS